MFTPGDPKRERIVFHSFDRSVFNEGVARGCVPGCSLPSAVVLLVLYMPARREYKRVEHFFCYISRFVFQELGGGRRGAGGFLPLAAAIPACIIAGRVASVQELFSFVLPPLNVYGLGGWVDGGGVCRRLSLSEVALLACM